METLSKITTQIRGDVDAILGEWRAKRAGFDGAETFERMSGRMGDLISVFAEFLDSPEGMDSFNRGGEIHTLVGRIADDQHDLGRDAVGVIEDFLALRRSLWHSVEGGVDLSDAPGGEVAGFFVKLMQASDWVTETALEAFDAAVRREMEQALGRAKATDIVTGLPDREQFDRLLLPEAVRENDLFAVAIFDVADFTGTVAEGNVGRAREVLRRLSETIGGAAPEGAARARYGDDEICAILPGRSGEDAYRVAESVLEQLADQPDGFEVGVGVAEYPEHGSDAGGLMAEALKALTMAKRVGGSGIVVAR